MKKNWLAVGVCVALGLAGLGIGVTTQTIHNIVMGVLALLLGCLYPRLCRN